MEQTQTKSAGEPQPGRTGPSTLLLAATAIGTTASLDWEFVPIVAHTKTVHRALSPVSFDCVKFIVVRAGSAIHSSEFGERLVTTGDVIALDANTLCGSEPEDWITVTTLYLDTNYLVDQVF